MTGVQTCALPIFVVHFLSPARPGDVLTATAEELNRTRRTGVYDVTVVNQAGTRIAVFRGTTQTIPGEHVPGLAITEGASP